MEQRGRLLPLEMLLVVPSNLLPILPLVVLVFLSLVVILALVVTLVLQAQLEALHVLVVPILVEAPILELFSS